MEREKLILLQIENEFYLKVPNEIYIGGCIEDTEGNILIKNCKYRYFVKDENINYTKDFHNIGYANFNGSINILLLYNNTLIIPNDIFKVHKDNFDKLRKILKKYDDIFDVELQEYYNNGNIKTNKIKIEYEMVKLNNPIKNRSYLFRLGSNNIPRKWVEQVENEIICKKGSVNSTYGNVSNYKVNLVNSVGLIPENIDFIINEEFANRLDSLFKSWNNGNIRSKSDILLSYLYNLFEQRVNLQENLCYININDKIIIVIDLKCLMIIRIMFKNNDIIMSDYNKLDKYIKCIKNKIDELNNSK